MPSPHVSRRAGAANVVMATGIVSIASGLAGVHAVSTALMWIVAGAFAGLALVNLTRLSHPVALLHRAGEREQALGGLGFVAAGCVVGTRIVDAGSVAHAVAAALLGMGALLWLVIAAGLARAHGIDEIAGVRCEWLLTTVATEGLVILATDFASMLPASLVRYLLPALWILGGSFYVMIAGAILRRWRRTLEPSDITPDAWILMGGLAIFCLAAAALIEVRQVQPEQMTGTVAWLLAAAWIPVLLIAEAWRARHLGLPHFTPQRWTMVFPLGMFSAAAQSLGRATGNGWLADIGRWWLVVAFAAWTALALGEIGHAFRETSSDHRSLQ